MNIDTGIKFLTLLIASAAAYYARRAMRQRDIEAIQTRPRIVRLNGFGKCIHLTITNNKPQPITIDKIIAKKRLIGPLFFKPMPLTWKPMEEYKPVSNPKEALARFSKTPQYFISKQQTIFIELLEHVPGYVYKLYVTTTGGKCQSIYHSPLERPNGQSDTEDKNKSLQGK